MTRAVAIAAFAAIVAAMGCARSKGDAPKPSAPAAMASASPSASASSQPPRKPIGVATMKADGTIVMQLRMEDPASGSVGDALFTMMPGDESYASTIEHLGGLKPGETKPVMNDWP